MLFCFAMMIFYFINNFPLFIFDYWLFSNNFIRYPFSSSSIKFSIKYLFPWSKMELTLGNRDNNFSAHNLKFMVCIPIIFPSKVMVLTGQWFMGSQCFKPFLLIPVQSRFVIIYKNRCGNMHGIYQT